MVHQEMVVRCRPNGWAGVTDLVKSCLEQMCIFLVAVIGER